MIGDFWQDVRYGLRSLRKHPLLSSVIIITLALGLGISTGIFTFFNAEFLRPRLYKNFDSFVEVYAAYTRDPTQPGRPVGMTLEDYLAFHDQAKSLGELAAYARFDALLGQDDQKEVRSIFVTPNFFSVFELERASMGRLLLPEDFVAGAAPVAVLSERLWRNRFATDPQIVGKDIYFNGRAVTVVGVAPDFAGMINGVRIWFPYTLDPYLKHREYFLSPGETPWLSVAGRLRPGFSRQNVTEELKLLAGQQDRLHPGRKTTITVTDGSPVQTPGDRSGVIAAVILMTGALTFFVMIVCTNISTLLLARATARRQEIAIRLALGVGRVRLIRMLLIETFLLTSMAGLGGLYIAYHIPDLMERWLFSSRTQISDLNDTWSLAPDWRAFVYLTLGTLLAGIMTGLLPAAQSLKFDLSKMLKDHAGKSGGANRSSRLFGLLVGAEVALNFFLLWGVLICARTYYNTVSFNLGFEPRHVLFVGLWARVNSTGMRYLDSNHRTLTERLEALPGVQSVAYSNQGPFQNPRMTRVETPDMGTYSAVYNEVSPDYFSMLRVPMLRGRPLQENDPPCNRARCVAVVSSTLANKFWPNENPIGKTLRGPNETAMEIVGVTGDSFTQRMGSDNPTVYLPFNPNVTYYHVYLRFSGDEATITRDVLSIIRSTYPELSVSADTIQATIDNYIENLSKVVSLVLMIGVMATFLSVIGIYGVTSFAVNQRLKEVGIRIALGAGKRSIYGAIFKPGVRPIIVGLLIGLTITVVTISAVEKAISAAVFNFDVMDPIIYLAAAFLLATASIVAMLGPARRATRVDPMKVLRDE